MASCTDPGTTSPGRLLLYYSNSAAAVEAQVGWDLWAGVDINDTAALQAEAQRLAVLLADCFITPVHITDWAVFVHGTGIYYGAPLPISQTGAHTLNSLMQAYKSTTVAFVGHAQPAAPGGCHGKVISRVHTFGAIDFPPGSKVYPAVSDTAYETFIRDGLNASTFLPADGYGQHAHIQFGMPVQFNAAYQKKMGS